MLATIDPTALGIRTGTPITASWSMYCGNDTDEVSIVPVFSPTPDIAVRSFSENNKGGMSFKYDVTGGTLTASTQASVFWVNSAGELLGSPLFTQTTATTVGTHGPFDIHGYVFEERPLNAARVALVLDPRKKLRESDETNNEIETFPSDPQDQISEAISLGTGYLTSEVTRTGKISHLDVDMYSVRVQPGQKVAFDIDKLTFTTTTATLRIFDATGNLLRDGNGIVVKDGQGRKISEAINSGDLGATLREDYRVDEAYLEITFPADSAGRYYIGVSAKGNRSYDATTGYNDSSSLLADYRLVVTPITYTPYQSGTNIVTGTVRMPNRTSFNPTSITVTLEAVGGSSPRIQISDGCSNVDCRTWSRRRHGKL